MNAYPPAPDPQQPSNRQDQWPTIAPDQPAPTSYAGQPAFGAPPTAPYGQYGQYPPASQYPQPPYGQYAPGQYAPPSQYPQPPYPAAPIPGYGPMGSSAGVNPRRRRRTVIGVIIAALLVLLVIGGIVRYNSPAAAFKAYIEAFYANNVDAAYALYCPEIQATFSRDQQATSMSSVDSHLSSYDLSTLSYDIVNESLTSAAVRLDGYFTYVDTTGASGTWQSADNNTDIFNFRAQGLGWCIWGVNGHTPVPGQTG